MPRYLSPEWLEELDRACRDGRPAPLATAGTVLVVQQLVDGATHGDVAYHVAVDADDGAVAVRRGMATDPTVTFSQDYDTAVAVARGEVSAQGAFMAGRIRVQGDLPRLAEVYGALAGMGDATRSLRDRTEF